ncbi:hypothetical protein BV898_08279 [Hypsibius exemplaris]|uniref:Gustatory receptor n=1 Tax=Hypsibius exemplaris TaxID=2072580 RepID=A0A1W0WR28_HYPEX|nr:hypothetical protein BV898_08279 [Hypsibius exemplaris]
MAAADNTKISPSAVTVIHPVFLVCMRFVGILQFDRQSYRSLSAATALNGCSLFQKILTVLWNCGLVAFIAVYMYYDYTQLFLGWYNELIEAMEFFTLVVLVFRMTFTAISALLIFAAFVRGGARVQQLLMSLGEELRDNRVQLKSYRRLVVGVTLVGVGLLVLLAASFVLMLQKLIGMVRVETGLQWTDEISFLASQQSKMNVPIWTFLIIISSGPLFAALSQCLIEIFLILTSLSLGFAFRKVAADLGNVKDKLSVAEGTEEEALVKMQRLEISHLNIHQIAEDFSGLFAFEVLLLSVRDAMSFLAVIALVFSQPGRREDPNGRAHIMNRALVWVMGGMSIFCLVCSITRVISFIWMYDKSCECLPVLRGISYHAEWKPLRRECAAFSRRIRRNPSAITLAGLCYINRPFITAALGAMLTFLVLIYQVQDQKKDIDQLIDRKETTAFIQSISDVLANLSSTSVHLNGTL